MRNKEQTYILKTGKNALYNFSLIKTSLNCSQPVFKYQPTNESIKMSDVLILCLTTIQRG